MIQAVHKKENPLASESIGKLIMKFAIPAIISNLVSALYNIVDQIFIGQGVGLLGNAATNVAFPLTTISISIALLMGVGSSSNFNLELGRGNPEKAGRIAGNGIVYMIFMGIALCITVMMFLKPLLGLFGATEEVMPYALTYTRITSFGLPFAIFTTGASQLIRADGSPSYAMVGMLSGAILNTILDPLFIFVFDMGMAGAAWATVIGQGVSAIIVAFYFTRFRTVKLSRGYFKPKPCYFKVIASLGAAACFNQLAMTLVQITLNNTLTYYGGLSHYGSEIPLACVGVISKVNIVFMSCTLGIAQGCQPINGFNYGAKDFERVKKTYKTALIAVTIIACTAFIIFQTFPRQIVSIFGAGSEDYYHFAERYFRIYMFMTFVNGIHPVTANFFTAIGEAKKGILLSLTRQILFLLPLITIFPMFLGIDGVMYAGPIADGTAAVLSLYLVRKQFKSLEFQKSAKN